MSYSRYRAWNFGPAYIGQLANAGYALRGDTAWHPATAVLSPTGAQTGAVEADVEHPDAYAGPLLWTPDSTATPLRIALVEINPGDDERTDQKLSALPAAVWANGSRTLTSFGYSVTLAPTGLDQVVVEAAVDGGIQINARQALSLIGSAVAGVITGEGGNTLAFAAMGNPTVPRISATISAQGREPTLTP